MDFAEVYRVVMHAPTGRVAVQEGMTGARKTRMRRRGSAFILCLPALSSEPRGEMEGDIIPDLSGWHLPGSAGRSFVMWVFAAVIMEPVA